LVLLPVFNLLIIKHKTTFRRFFSTRLNYEKIHVFGDMRAYNASICANSKHVFFLRIGYALQVTCIFSVNIYAQHNTVIKPS
jgi:hypothetical protein